MNNLKPMSRWRWLGLMLGMYVAAVLITLWMYTCVTLISGFFVWDVFVGVIWAFPGGLLLFLHDVSFIFGYIVYATVIAAGVIFRHKIILLILLSLLALNISGCLVTLYQGQKNQWRTDNTAPPKTGICFHQEVPHDVWSR